MRKYSGNSLNKAIKIMLIGSHLIFSPISLEGREYSSTELTYHPHIENKIERGAKQARFENYKLARSFIHLESNGIEDAISKENALGLSQILLETAKDLDPNTTQKRLLRDGTHNVYLGLSYFKKIQEEQEKKFYDNEIFDNYINSYQVVYGKNPTLEELSITASLIRYHGGNVGIDMFLNNPERFKEKMPLTSSYPEKVLELYDNYPVEYDYKLKKEKEIKSFDNQVGINRLDSKRAVETLKNIFKTFFEKIR